MSLSVAVLVGQVVASAPVCAAGPEWMPPVPGGVVRPFQEPLAVYAAGHRGVDFSAAAGTPVRAANSGVVSFAGTVAGSLHVVVAHGGGIRTSYSFLQRVDVHVGEQVERGQIVGAAGGSGDGHTSGVLHFGVRVGERYVDPMLLFEPDDLTQLVRLVPVDGRDAAGKVDPAGDGWELARWLHREDPDPGDSSCGDLIGDVAGVLGLGGLADSACEAVGKALEHGLDLLDRAGGAAAEAAKAVGPAIHAVLARMEEAGETVAEAARAVADASLSALAASAEAAELAANALTDTFAFVYELGIKVFEALSSCPQPDPVAHPKGSGNAVMVVAGQSSSRTRRADGSVSASMHFEAHVLGYHDGDASYFSYEAHSETYTKHATFGDLHEKARLLGEQLARCCCNPARTPLRSRRPLAGRRGDRSVPHRGASRSRGGVSAHRERRHVRVTTSRILGGAPRSRGRHGRNGSARFAAREVGFGDRARLGRDGAAGERLDAHEEPLARRWPVP